MELELGLTYPRGRSLAVEDELQECNEKTSARVDRKENSRQMVTASCLRIRMESKKSSVAAVWLCSTLRINVAGIMLPGCQWKWGLSGLLVMVLCYKF